jgi:hypothetical protein
VITVAESPEPITTMAGVRVLPDALLANLESTASDLLILPGTARHRVRNGLIKRFSWARLVSNQRPLACEGSAGGAAGISSGHF